MNQAQVKECLDKASPLAGSRCVSVLALGALEAPVFPAFLSMDAEEPGPYEPCPGCLCRAPQRAGGTDRVTPGHHLLFLCSTLLLPHPHSASKGLRHF